MNFILWFLSAQILIIIAYLLCTGVSLKFRYSEKLCISYLGLSILGVVLTAQFFIPVHSTFQPLQKMGIELSKPMRITSIQQKPLLNSLASENFNSFSEKLGAPVKIQSPALLFLFFFTLIFIFRIFKDLRFLFATKRTSFKIRKIGNLEILVNDHVSVPLTFWIPSRATIIIPTRLLSHPKDFRISVLHEIQHHRQRDPIWIYGLEALKIFAWLNPFARMWIRKITELQEFACDETLVDRSKVNSRQYARCLLQVAESSLQSEFVPACASGLLFRMERHQLKRRIKMLLAMKTNCDRSNPSEWMPLFLVLFLALSLGGAAYASKSIAHHISDRTYTIEEVKELAKNITEAEGIPVAINHDVVEQLNRMVGSPGKRQKIRTGLARMKTDFRSIVDAMLKNYDLPKALEAIPLIESNYENLDQTGKVKAAGIWMFIPSTARNWGLRVDHQADHQVDERVTNIPKLTDAAGKLLKENAALYGDLGLSILAYNWGDKKVDEMIRTTNYSRDPWVLSRAFQNDTYLPMLIAGMLIIANPKIAEEREE